VSPAIVGAKKKTSAAVRNALTVLERATNDYRAAIAHDERV
jgi:hypothetical protein